jgi:dUTP pyrophosphatase
MSNNIINDLFKIYDKVMLLKIYIDSDNNELKDLYLSSSKIHNNKLINSPYYIDAGFDLFAPPHSNSNKLDFKISCSAKIYTDAGKIFNTGYYLHPRSSIYKTPLRLANSTGIIDAGYRGHIMAVFDNHNIPNFSINDYDRYIQVCAPSLIPIIIEIVDSKEDLGEITERGEGGFGSTGN